MGLGSSKQWAAAAENLLMEGETTEKLVFRKFSGEALLKVATGQKDGLDSKDVTTVTLVINPQELSYSSQKIINKVPTNAPGRFVVYDWGLDLTILSITGVTGNLLPDFMTKGIGIAAPGFGVGVGLNNAVTGALSKLVTSQLSYFDTLKMSKKYRTFIKLQDMYTQSDADSDVITLEIGDTIYRGYFSEFKFSISQASPWNWTYTVSFTILKNLSELNSKSDKKTSNSSQIDKTV